MSRDDLTKKEISERRHRYIFTFLKKNFPGCEIYYDGVEGIDFTIVFNDKATFLEGKSYDYIIGGGIQKVASDRPVVFERKRLGRFVFSTKSHPPYTKSQHDDLLEANGWYVFVVGNKTSNKILFGCKAKEIGHIAPFKEKRLTWPKAMNLCYPDWIRRLKIEVYDI